VSFAFEPLTDSKLIFSGPKQFRNLLSMLMALCDVVSRWSILEEWGWVWEGNCSHRRGLEGLWTEGAIVSIAEQELGWERGENNLQSRSGSQRANPAKSSPLDL